MAEGKAIIEFKKIRKAKSSFERRILKEIESYSKNWETIGDHPDMGLAKAFLSSIMKEGSFHHLKLVETDSSVYIVRLTTVSGKQEKLFGFEAIADDRSWSEEDKRYREAGQFIRRYENYELRCYQIAGIPNKMEMQLINLDTGKADHLEHFTADHPSNLNKAIEAAKVWVKNKQQSISNTKPHIMTLQVIPIDKIYPSKENYRSDFDESTIKELADSIANHGIIQPILLRSNGKAGSYQIVCGERRYRAAKMAGLTEMPANIRELTDDQAFEMRITENLQRKDVHPMDEAVAYRTYQERHNHSIEELAARFAKSKEYIAQRLSFNSLIPEMQKEFYSGLMLIGHAVLFARLQPADQKQGLKDCKSNWGNDKGKYEPIDDVKEWISDEIMHVLGEAAFDKKDAVLVPKAGSCTACPKRSGSGLLFGDIKEKDRCFDGKCFAGKKIAHAVMQLKNLVLTEPAMPVVQEQNEKMDPEIAKIVKDNKLKVLTQYNDYTEDHSKSKNSTMALVVAGMDTGKIIGIKFKTTEKAKAAKSASSTGDSEAMTAADIDQQIAGIKERTKRSADLDKDKVHARITAQLTDLKPFVEESQQPLLPAEYDALVFIAFERCPHDMRNKLKTKLKLKGMAYSSRGDMELAQALAGASNDLRNYIIRSAIANDFISLSILPSNENPKSYLVRKIAEGYPGVPITEYESEQKVIREKREASASKRITDLNKKKKDLKPSAKSKSKK